MKIVHTMIRVNDLDESLKFYCDGLGMKLLKKREYPSGRFTNAFVGYGSEETDAVIELTYNWDAEEYRIGRAFGHLAYEVDDIYAACQRLREHTPPSAHRQRHGHRRGPRVSLSGWLCPR